jgi:hypothetical protein
MILQMAALLVLGLMCGSELNVALFSHPVLQRQPLETHVPVRSALAVLLGRVMPFWMAGSTLLNLPLRYLRCEESRNPVRLIRQPRSSVVCTQRGQVLTVFYEPGVDWEGKK